MKIDAAAVRKCLKSFDFATLFREHLGWDNHQARIDIPAGDTTISLTAVAQKRGFVAFLCPTILDRPTRLKIDHKVTKSVREHFIIYTDQANGRQVWHWVRREPGKPLASRDHRFDITQSGDPLIQRLDHIAVSMDEEEAITVVDVAGRVRAALDVDKITKKFYERFKAEHAAFLKLIKGIKTESDLAWYTSLMLNRLMFVYFIQKKGFLDGDTDYLKNRLTLVQKQRGKDRFQSFYRYFLLRLFHEGLGKAPGERKIDPTMEKLLGRVPFLNGGFFEVHQLEEQNPDIDIPDKAFEKLFVFFDQYRWHLDERPLRADNEINPDVVGYIFEKYINQKQMGAYYTKEDITEYISKNTLIPFIFDAAEKKCPIAFKPDSFLWRLLREDPDRYIYPAVKHGVIHADGSFVPETDLPDFVQIGMHKPKARMYDKDYNLQQALDGDSLRLVTETWREYINRRIRCLEIREKLKKGEVHHVNDLVTLNLDIWQFARDAIITSEGPELLRAFWQTIEKVTVLDPTCGSGAFLFAALRILETLYSDCLERMGRFVEDANTNSIHPKQFSDFKQALAQIDKHPSERYFILKSIILNNLYGVDIMAEAVEICKLRLFLNLVAQVERVGQIEPLPDMDFNIRTGNTLVGYATEEHARKAFTGKAAGKHTQLQIGLADETKAYQRFEEDLLIVEKAFQQFRYQQTTHGERVTHQDKQELRERLGKLDAELDRYLAYEYGISAGSYKAMKVYEEAFDRWKASHQPFHWFVEFYGIMHGGGFDVVIGNPPYVEYKDIKSTYLIKNFKTEACSNLFVFVLERCVKISKSGTEIGIIVPLSAFSTDRMIPLIEYLKSNSTWLRVANFSWRPGKLFDGVNLQLSILLQKVGKDLKLVETTRYIMWDSEARKDLFSKIEYSPVSDGRLSGSIPKLGSCTATSILKKIRQKKKEIGGCFTRNSTNLVYYRRGGLYWKVFVNFQTESSEEKIINLQPEINNFGIIAVLSSDLWWWYFTITSDCRHLGNRDINTFPFDPREVKCERMKMLCDLGRKYVEDLKHNAENKIRVYKHTKSVECMSFRVNKSKEIINKIDQFLSDHFGLTDEETDFITNYDIKHRMGGENGNEDEP